MPSLANAADVAMAAMQRVADQARSAGASAKEIANANERDSNSMLDALALNAGADKTLVEEAWKATKAVEDAKKRADDAAGGEGELLDLISSVVAGGKKVRTIAAEVERKQNRSISDIISDPVGTIKDLWTLGDSETALQGAITTTAVTASAATQRHTVLQQGFKEADDLKNTVTAATLKAAGDKIDAIRMENSAKVRIQSRMYNMDGVKTALGMSVQEASSLQAVEAQKIQLANLAISQTNSATSQAHLKLSQQQFAEQQKLRGEQSDEIAFASEMISRGMLASGVKPPEGTAARLHAKEALTDKNSPFYQYYARGLLNSAISPTSTKIGATAADAYTAVSRADVPMNIPAAVQPVIQILKEAATLTKGVDRKTQPDAWNKAYNQNVADLLAGQSGNINSDSILNVGPVLPSYIQGSPALSALPFTQKFLAPMMQAGTPISDAKVTLRLGLEAVGKGIITPDELIGGMGAVYRQSAIAHAQALRLGDFGMRIPYSVGAEYNVRMGFGDTVNLTNATELGRWVARNLAINTYPELAREKMGAGVREAFSEEAYGRAVKKGAANSYLNNPNFGKP